MTAVSADARPDVAVKILQQLDDPLLDEAWKLYVAAFTELNTMAVQRHLMYRSEFDQVMVDPRVDKYAVVDDAGTLAGLATYTNNLDAVPLIAPEYFEHHYPQHYAGRRIWYIGFVAVRPDAQGTATFKQMIEQMYLIASAQHGLVGLDICSYNDEVHNMSRVFRVMVRRWTTNMRFTRIDQQSTWLYEFPAPA